MNDVLQLVLNFSMIMLLLPNFVVMLYVFIVMLAEKWEKNM